jgi:hypothetical protein
LDADIKEWEWVYHELLKFVRLLVVRTIGFHMDGFSPMADDASSPAHAMGEQGCFGASLAV